MGRNSSIGVLLLFTTALIGCNTPTTTNTSDAERADSLKQKGYTLLQGNIAYKRWNTTDSTLALKAGDHIEMRYKVYTPNGLLISSKHATNDFQKTSVANNTYVPGLEIALQHLHAYDSAEVWIPAHLAYGDKNYGSIKANSWVVYRIQLRAAYRKQNPVNFAMPDEKPKVLAPGLKVWVITMGNGKIAKQGQAIRLHYAARLPNQTLIDDSYSRGYPFGFLVDGGMYLKAWNEVAKHYPIGTQVKVEASYPWAYNEKGIPNKVPPKATVWFDIELIAITPNL